MNKDSEKHKLNPSQNEPKLEKPETDIEDLLAIAYEPTPDFISVETLAKEQGYSIEKLRAAHANIDHSLFEDEDLDEFLALI